LVATPGSPATVKRAHEPAGTGFPATKGGRPLANDLAHVAHLEALRFAGHDTFIVPEGSRPWFRGLAEFRHHLSANYRTVADEAGAGAVFDLTAPAAAGTRSLRAEVTELAAELPAAPAVLDLTATGVAAELPGFTTFRPPPGDALPYLDGSVDIVVVDRGGDTAEAARVASHAVVTVEVTPAGSVQVLDARGRDRAPALALPRTLVWCATAARDERFERALTARVGATGAEVRVGRFDADALAATDLDAYDVLVVVESQVLPLPEIVEIAAATAASDPATAVTGKVVRGDGTLDSAGGTVFFDRSVGLVAHGSADLNGPWHEYARPVCWAPGFVAAATSLWREVARPAHVEGRAFVREWCSEVWAAGHGVRYEPGLVAVRVTGDGGEASAPLQASAWQRVLDFRPARPAALEDGAWRYLLAHDDVETCRA
jgi:hypothetical protein